MTDRSGADSGVAVEGGRAWVGLSRYDPVVPYRVVGAAIESRSLDGGAARRTDLDFSGVVRPEGARAAFDSPHMSVFRVRDGRAFILGGWWREDSGDDPTRRGEFSGLTFLAVFDVTSGALLRQQQFPDDGPRVPSPPVRFLSGNPAVSMSAVGERLEAPLLDPWTSVPLPFPGSADTRIAGAFALVPSPQSGGSVSNWADGSGTLRVVEVASGRIVYRLSARRVTRAAGAPRDARPEVTLMPDGSLGVAIATGGRVVRPVAVDPLGNVVRVGRSLRRTSSVAAVLVGARAFVGVEATAKARGRARGVRRLWLVDREGRRGYRVSTAAKDGMQRDFLVPFWSDGQRALWSTRSPKGQRVGLAAVTGVGRIVLRRGVVPTTARNR